MESPATWTRVVASIAVAGLEDLTRAWRFLVDERLVADSAEYRQHFLAVGERERNREITGFSAAQRVALKLGDMITRTGDRPDPNAELSHERFNAWIAAQPAAQLADVRAVQVRLRAIDGPDAGKTFDLRADKPVLVGRGAECNWVMTDLMMSRAHFRVEARPPDLFVSDAGSTSGTFADDTRVGAAGLLVRSGGRIRAGRTGFVVERELPLPPTIRGANVSPMTGAPPPEAPPAPSPASSSPAAPSSSLAKLLGAAATDPGAATVVRCTRCGDKAVNEAPRPRAEQVVYFCAHCQLALLDEPVILPGYQIVKELGRGGMGAVYLAVHDALGVKRALKVIIPRAAMPEKLRLMFVREAKQQAKLNHPRIVHLYDLAEVRPGLFCMAMQFIDGCNADGLLERAGGALDWQLATKIVIQALEGLGHAHDLGIVHRDIKDANLLVAMDAHGEPSVKVADFGLAKSYETSGASGFTSTGQLAGTVAYMAPEQVRNFRDVKPPADLYSMGATLYRLLSGATPHDFPDGLDPLLIIMERPIVPLALRKPGLPAALVRAVERALAPEPEARFADAEAMRQSLLDALG